MQFATSPDGQEVEIQSNERLTKFKKWFQNSVDKADKWRKVAREDRDFYIGEQWKKSDKEKLEDAGRPAVTINRIKPLLNVLSGYQRLNRYDIDFLPRTNDDMALAQVRKGVTKYVMDQSNYNYEESDVFNDGVMMGIGWFEVGYKFDWERMDGDAFIRRVSPFDIYVDSESRDKYFRDAKYIIRARWIDKDELSSVYPEHKDEIEAQSREYLSEENEDSSNQLWYEAESKKIRFAECWYKKTVKKKVYILTNGTTTNTVTPEMLMMGAVADVKEYTANEIHLMTFFDNVVLEDKKSPYEHGYIPFVAFPCYYLGDDDIPAGVIRDLKDPQRDLNKRRSQELHILNTQSNGGWITEQGAMTTEQEARFKARASTPGALLEVSPGSLTNGRLQRLEPQAPPAGVINATNEAANELPAISGINEALMGTDINNLQSGRAIELKQKQAITHIALLFDHLRHTKQRIAMMLWGRRGAKGIIPQFYTEQKTFRIVGKNGEPEFITVNQQVQQRDPQTMQVVSQTLNDLSVGEFDIVISDTPATATQRTAQFWSLVDACGKLGIQGSLVLDILLDLSDIPEKEEIKRRLKEQQQQQAQAQQQQMQAQLAIEREKKLSRSIAYKDLQLPLQLQLAAKAGIFPQEYADKFMQWSVEQYAQQMGMVQQPIQQPQITQQVPVQQLMQQQVQPIQQQPTQAEMNGFVAENKPII